MKYHVDPVAAARLFQELGMSEGSGLSRQEFVHFIPVARYGPEPDCPIGPPPPIGAAPPGPAWLSRRETRRELESVLGRAALAVCAARPDVESAVQGEHRPRSVGEGLEYVLAARASGAPPHPPPRTPLTSRLAPAHSPHASTPLASRQHTSPRYALGHALAAHLSGTDAWSAAEEETFERMTSDENKFAPIIDGHEEAIEALFKSIDTDADGVLDKHELKDVVAR